MNPERGRKFNFFKTNTCHFIPFFQNMNPERGRKYIALLVVVDKEDAFQNMNPERGRK